MALAFLAKMVHRLLVLPLAAHLARVEEATRRAHLDRLLEGPRYADPRGLSRQGYRCFSQNDEDGVIDEIFRRIGTTNRRFVEIGVEGGLENNTLALLTAGWSGLWIEADPASQAAIRAGFAQPLASGQLALAAARATAENLEGLLDAAAVPAEPDLLSIDVDGIDYWLWKAVATRRPRVVVVEYNASLGRTARLTVPYRPDFAWDQTSYHGASLAALEALGREKGYALVGCGIRGVNAFFVRQDLVGERFLGPFTAETHYEPPRHGPTGAGHPPRWGELVEP